MTIEGDQLSYDLTGSHPAIGSFINAGFGSAFSGVIAGTKTFFPDVPLNSGFYRAVQVDLGPEGSVVNAPWPVAVTGFCAGPVREDHELDLRAVVGAACPSGRSPARFNLEYLLVGGRDGAPRQPADLHVVRLDGRRLGRAERQGRLERDGADLRRRPRRAAARGAGAALPRADDGARDPSPTPAGPGKFRGGCGVEKGAILTRGRGNGDVLHAATAHARSPGASRAGLPSIPHGVWLNAGRRGAHSSGRCSRACPAAAATRFTRPSAGGGGFGDPLERNPAAVLEDVADGYVSVERARKDYGVVVREIDPDLAEYEIDEAATTAERERIARRRGGAGSRRIPRRWPSGYRAGDVDQLDVIRRHGVILDWGTGELLPKTTEQFRSMLRRRMVAHWA